MPDVKIPSSVPADSLAFALLCAGTVVKAVTEGRTLDAALADCWNRHSPLPAVRGAIQDLAYGTLRAGSRNDFFLRGLLRAPLAEDDARCMLLVALFRLQQRPEDAHTTVDQAVTAIATLAQGRYKALCNAILRNFLRQRDALESNLAEDEVARWQHPAWWIAAVRESYPHDWEEILRAANLHPPMTLRANRRRGDANAYIGHLQSAGVEARVLDDTAVMLLRPKPVEMLPGFADGDVSVQDWGAQRAARLLDARAGMRVLDACAAPGGKTSHILELADVDMTAVELD